MAGLRPYIFGRPDACNRLHAPRRGGASVGLLSLPGRCRTRWRMWWMVRAMHERAVGGVNGLLARGWKESTSTHQEVRYPSSESRARVMRREVVSSEVPWADAADIGGDGLRMRAACGWCWGWCDCPAGVRFAGGEGCAMPEWYSSAKTLGEGVPNWKDCSRVPLRSMLQEATGGAEQ
jgi:hypothetical protein